ncbi:hypothetical protein VSDG_02712 [Cytospora chrysosperma]|uniref:Rhodopsin domain-containing protein n=1 Tax=Cytospora chrysosperma TaxID=252740 RepID=A0A423WD59_CYTCH|nr:hypothetical protein VSDG_02712 [Valsa sordida]
MQYNFAMDDVCFIISGIVKLSVALVLYRLDPRRLIRLTLIADIIICSMWTIVATLVLSLGCTDLSLYTFSNSVCRNTKYSQEASYVIFDLFHVVLPIVILWRVQISRAQKLGIVCLFGVGLLAAAAAVMKLEVYVEAYHPTATTDYIALWYRGVIWAFSEHGLSLFASSILALRPITKYISRGFMALTSTLYGSSKGSKSSDGEPHSLLSKGSDRSKKSESAEMNTIGVRNDVSVYTSHVKELIWYELALVKVSSTIDTYFARFPIGSGTVELAEHLMSVARSLPPLKPASEQVPEIERLLSKDENNTPPSTPKGAGGGYTSLTARENEILSKAMNCLKAPPEIDYEKLAGEVGMSNPRSAANAWGAIKKKMSWNTNTPAAGKSTAGAKRKSAATTSNDSDADEDASPAKKAKAPAKPRKKAPVAPKKAAATPKKGKTAAAPKSSVTAKESSEEEGQVSDDKEVEKSAKATPVKKGKAGAASKAAAVVKEASEEEEQNEQEEKGSDLVKEEQEAEAVKEEETKDDDAGEV